MSAETLERAGTFDAAPVKDWLIREAGDIAAIGDVGGEDRLDFTVVGPAVNLAARIESLSAGSANQLLVSEDFARHSSVPYQALGAFRFHGIEGCQKVHVLPRPDGE